MTTETNAQGMDRRTNRIFAKVSPSNFPFAVAILELRRTMGTRPSSNYQFMHHLVQLDRHLQGRPFDSATAEDIKALLSARRETGAAAGTLKLLAVNVKTMLWQARRLNEAKELPFELRQALKLPKAKSNVRGAVIPEATFLAALEAVQRLNYDLCSYAPELVRCLLWILWDSGMRIGEVLSLRLNDVSFDEGTKTAKLQLREELAVSHGLKTGARYVILRDAVPALRTWMAVHPDRLDGEAPLITALAYYRHVRGLNQDSVRRIIREVFALVGAKPAGQRGHYGAHDFRHTAATRDANAGYREAALRLKYGWSATSAMPAHYVHLSEADARARVLATPVTGAAPMTRAPAPTADLVNQLATQLAQAMAQMAQTAAPA
jgi:integrase